ncbi:dubious [Schizosaccharomyces pombe]|uniref:Uncharacterized protein new14 n=1 Tax=Schizosaccharomyces pombe (strain 972 / ATCC 24843) TaxID=284812 RepID=NEW14_SCHPO|nr:uncharacterized protein SPBC839.20 [Schizosaccharomyces pombe]G2TRS1.1 RecName: Full=Uncharacterized protein new14 [Schizosaccharomyces pombe 972h-]CCD31352.1 dubious [Schizosaccharomyces pombe]|eukprot:NP_001343142.1 uncharacterized protein SPBC839.20 [Schizosaccharomyces pombe]
MQKKEKIIENLEKAGNTFHLIIKCNTIARILKNLSTYAILLNSNILEEHVDLLLIYLSTQRMWKLNNLKKTLQYKGSKKK